MLKQGILRNGVVSVPNVNTAETVWIETDANGVVQSYSGGGKSGWEASATFTPTAAAYSAADIMDTAKAFTPKFANAGNVPNGSLLRITSAIIKIDATALQASEAAYTLQVYNVTPPSALADNGAWTLASTDLPAYRGSVGLGTPADLGAALFLLTTGLAIDIKLGAAVNTFYAQLQTVAGFTATAVARQIFLHGIVL